MDEQLNLVGIVARQHIYELNQSRLVQLAERAAEKERQGLGAFVVVCIDADDPKWASELELLMPGHNWQQYRDRHERPFGRGVVAREIGEALVDSCPDVGKIPAGVHVLVLGAGGLSIYPVSNNNHNHNIAIINFAGQPAKVSCDRKCEKAFGASMRGRVSLSSNEDDYAFLADNELGFAPADPGTTEGDERKPLSPDHFPTKWCVRECERCSMSKPGEWNKPLAVKSFNERSYNIKRM